MTISNLRCDLCDALLPGLIPDRPNLPDGPDVRDGRAGGVRFSYHPGDPRMRDDSGVVCTGCWSQLAGWLGEPRERTCAVCSATVARTTSLHLRRVGAQDTWRLCSVHAAEMLNRLSTVEPKFDPETFQLPLARVKEGPKT